MEPLSIVQFEPSSTPSFKITLPMCGILIFFPFIGINPKPFSPILHPSWTTTLLPIIEFLITT